MINIHEERLKMKLILWQSPGFQQFLNDLQVHLGPEIDLSRHVSTIKRLYTSKLKEIEEEKLKFKQGKLPL